MKDRRYWPAVEMPEYTAQYDSIVSKYSLNVIGPVLDALLWGIHTNPLAYDLTLQNFRIAKSRSLGLTIPTFMVIFQIQNEDQEDEHILLCWIEETSTLDEMADYSM
jgi:hypothetical protein